MSSCASCLVAAGIYRADFLAWSGAVLYTGQQAAPARERTGTVTRVAYIEAVYAARIVVRAIGFEFGDARNFVLSV